MVVATDPLLLLPVLNTIFVFAVSVVTAYLAARVFLAAGTWEVLLFGSGLLMYGTASLVAGWLRGAAGQNVNATIHNTGTLIAALFPFCMALLTVKQPGSLGRAKRRLTLVAFYGVLLAVVVVLTVLSLQGWLPPFYMPEAQPTLLRKVVLGTASALFAVSALSLLSYYRRTKSDFFYWCALGLGLLALGLAVLPFSVVFADPLGWMGRIAQYVGGLYLLVGILILVMTTRTHQMPVSEVVGEFFKQAKMNYQLLVETATDSIVSVDDQGRVLLWNRAAEKMFGASRDQAIGGLFLDMVIPAEHLESVRKEVAASAQGDSQGSRVAELTARRSDGQEFPIEMTLATDRTRRSSSPTITTFIMRDITGRKKAERELRENHLLVKAMAEGAYDPIFIKDRLGCILFANPAMEKVMDRPLVEILGKSDTEILSNTEDARVLAENDRRIMDSGRTEVVEETVTTTAGRLTFLSTKTPWRDDKGNVIGIIGVAHDITERKKVEDLKDEFIGMMSHEMKTPLTVILGGLHTLVNQGSQLTESERSDLLQDAYLEAGSLADMVSNLLDLSLCRSGQLVLVREDVELPKLLRHMVRRAKTQHPKHRFKTKCASLPQVSGDRVRLERIVYNLLDNAARYSPAGSCVTISAEVSDSRVVLGVKDEGEGLSAGAQAKLFTKFERLGRSSAGGPRGTGLGLAVCKRLVEAQGGRIWVESEVGMGSTFYFTIPLNRETFPQNNE
ncbi:MAG: PAS domain-containing sensor histidine kinase [Chloroflexi bacterium]|nr:PAS domain-containing sensor histidine kinase [Chloroflexota bacterium]